MIPALRGKWLALLCLLPFALFFIAFQIAPLLWVASNSLHTSEGWSLGNFSEAFSSPFYRQAMRHSLEVAFWSSLIGISIAIQVATRCARSTASCATSSWRFPT